MIHGPLPDATIDLRVEKPTVKVETLQLLDTVLAQHGITMVVSGDNVVKAVPTQES